MNPLTDPNPYPPEPLRVQCIRMLPRLQLIPEFKPWIGISLQSISLRSKHKATPYTTLWHCFALGAPLCVLLELLGTSSSWRTHVSSERSTSRDALEQEKLVKIFIDRVQLLELQGRLPYGEVFRVEDLFDGTHQGFAKVRDL